MVAHAIKSLTDAENEVGLSHHAAKLAPLLQNAMLLWPCRQSSQPNMPMLLWHGNVFNITQATSLLCGLQT